MTATSCSSASTCDMPPGNDAAAMDECRAMPFMFVAAVLASYRAARSQPGSQTPRA